MNIIIVSDRFYKSIDEEFLEGINNKRKDINKIEIISWGENFRCPPFEDYEIVIVDMWKLYEYENKKEKLPILKYNFDILKNSLKNALNSRRLWVLILDKYVKFYLTTFDSFDILDWLPTEIKLNIESKETPGLNVELKNYSEYYINYFNGVKNWYYITKNINYKGYNNKIIAEIKDSFPISIKYSKLKNFIKENLFDSMFLILPKSEIAEKELILNILDITKNEFNEYYNNELEKQEKPLWLEDYKFKEMLNLEKEIDKKEKEIEWYENIFKILYTKGSELEESVNFFFGEKGSLIKFLKSDEKINIEKLPKGSHIDFELNIQIKDNSYKYGVEVTSSKTKLKKDNSKIDNILLSEVKTDNFIVLVNTYYDLPLIERLNEENFTKEVLEMKEKLKINITLITSLELFIIYFLMKENKLKFKDFVNILNSGKEVNLSKNNLYKDKINFFVNYFKGGKNV